MSRIDGDRRRLEDLRQLYEVMSDMEMPASTRLELETHRERLIGAARCADDIIGFVERIVGALADIYARLKRRPATGDG
jgi:hypothetical protein